MLIWLTLNCLACIYVSANPLTLSKGSKVIKMMHISGFVLGFFKTSPLIFHPTCFFTNSDQNQSHGNTYLMQFFCVIFGSDIREKRLPNQFFTDRCLSRPAGGRFRFTDTSSATVDGGEMPNWRGWEEKGGCVRFNIVWRPAHVVVETRDRGNYSLKKVGEGALYL